MPMKMAWLGPKSAPRAANAEMFVGGAVDRRVGSGRHVQDSDASTGAVDRRC